MRDWYIRWAQGFYGNLNRELTAFMAWWSESMMIAPGLLSKQKKEVQGAEGRGLGGGRDWNVGRWDGLEGGKDGRGRVGRD